MREASEIIRFLNQTKDVILLILELCTYQVAVIAVNCY